MEKINLEQKLGLFSDYWSPKIVGNLNENFIKLVKCKGEFCWHKHEEDEMFLVVKGKLVIKLRDKDVELNEGEIFVVEKGIEHMPICEEEVSMLLIEPKTILNSGDKINEKTVEKLDII